jgi:hypothetical protein
VNSKHSKPKYPLHPVKFKATTMHNRRILMRRVSKVAGAVACADCHSIARYEIIELELPVERWFWCGQCDIGG